MRSWWFTSNIALQIKEKIIKEKFQKVLYVQFINHKISPLLLSHFNLFLLHTHTHTHKCACTWFIVLILLPNVACSAKVKGMRQPVIISTQYPWDISCSWVFYTQPQGDCTSWPHIQRCNVLLKCLLCSLMCVPVVSTALYHPNLAARFPHLIRWQL